MIFHFLAPNLRSMTLFHAGIKKRLAFQSNFVPNAKLWVLNDCYLWTDRDPVDINTLRRAAASKGGLLTDELRRKVWPKLLNINVYDLPHRPG